MHPVSCKDLAVACLRLCDLVFMMWEDQIFAACMNIDLITEVFFAHNGAFDMPARTTVAPWRFPVWLAVFFRFP